MQRISSLVPAGPADESAHRGARRQSTRYPIHGEVKVIAPIEAEGFLFNASVGGLRIAVDKAIDEGTTIDLRVHLTDDQKAQERGEVVWCRELPDGWLVGVRFLDAGGPGSDASASQG